MTSIVLSVQWQRSKLIRELETRWPGCGAHTKVNQATKQEEIRCKEFLPEPQASAILNFAAGWMAAMDAASREILAGNPFTDETVPGVAGRGLPVRRKPGGRGATSRPSPADARAQLESLFQPSEGGGS